MEKNKTGKYLKYAIGEIILVVIGILIALQINTWNEKRKEHSLENSYLLRLKSEIASDTLVFIFQISENKLKNEEIQRFSNLLNSDKSNDFELIGSTKKYYMVRGTSQYLTQQ